MTKNLLIIVTMLLVYVSSMALEPVRVGLTYPSGLQNSNPKVEVDVFDYNGSGKKYPLASARQDFGNIQANASGGAQIILGHNLVGEDDPDWGPLSVSVANNSTMVRVYVNGSIVTQLKLKDLIEAQQTTGDGDVIPSGIDAQGGVISTSDPDDDLVVGGNSVDHSSGTETKMFFNNTKAAFRAGTVSGTNWDEANLGQSSSATGENTSASGEGSVASGKNTIASGDYSNATGENTTASGDHSSASGEGTVAKATYEVAVGSFNTDYTPAGDATDRAFSIGNGTGTGSRSDAFVVRKNGNTLIGGTLQVTGETTLNSNTEVSGTNTFTVGTGATTIGGDITLSNETGSGNQALYVDNAGLVTANNGDAARKASGMISGKHTTTATTTQTIANTNVAANSVIIVTYQGTVVASHRITGINAGSDFTVEFSVAPLAGETVHYMIINN